MSQEGTPTYNVVMIPGDGIGPEIVDATLTVLDAAAEKQWRDKALSTWPTNPEVDHLIGKKLSQKYRFAEGAEYQRKAIAMDPRHLPAKIQLM